MGVVFGCVSQVSGRLRGIAFCLLNQVCQLIQLLVDQDPSVQGRTSPTPKQGAAAGGAVAAPVIFRPYEALVPVDYCALELNLDRSVVETILTFLSQRDNGGYLSLNTMCYSSCTVSLQERTAKASSCFLLCF